jgi:AcrR family transcriptional regulator
MKPPRIDPRIVRTRAALREGLATLLRDRSFEELTLNDIAAAAGLNRATIYKHHPDKFALLDALVSDELQTRLLTATAGGEWAGATKLAAVIRAACQCLQWIGSLGRPDDRLLRPIAEARVRTLLLRAMEFGLDEKLLLPVSKPELAAAMASGAVYGAAEGWAATGAASPRALDAYVTRVIAALASTVVPNPHPPPRSSRPLKFD